MLFCLVKDFAYHLAVVKVVLDAAYFLIVLVSLACDEHYCAASGHRDGLADGLAAVGDVECLGTGGVIEPGFHLCDDGLGLLEAGIV